MEALSGLYSAMNGSGDVWRERGFKKAAAVLRGLGTQITNFDQIKVMLWWLAQGIEGGAFRSSAVSVGDDARQSSIPDQGF